MQESKELVIRAQAGDMAAFDALVRRFQDMAVGYAGALLGDSHLAEDAAQEAFIRAFLELQKLRDPAAFAGWFRHIVFTRCTAIRRRRRMPALDPLEADTIACDERNAQAVIEESENRQRIFTAIRCLPAQERPVLALFYLSGLTQGEIAAFLGIPPATVNNRLHSSKKRLKKELVRMSKKDLGIARPSHDPRFADKVRANLRAVEAIHADFTSQAGLVLGEALGARATATIKRLEISTFTDFIESLELCSASLSFNIKPIAGRIILDISKSLAFPLLQTLGHEREAAQAAEADYMAWEQAEKLVPTFKRLMGVLADNWRPAFAAEITDATVHTNLHGEWKFTDFEKGATSKKFVAEGVFKDDLAMRMALEVQCRELGLAGQLSLCYPAVTMEYLLPHVKRTA